MGGDPVPSLFDALRNWFERTPDFLRDLEQIERKYDVRIPVKVSLELQDCEKLDKEVEIR
jgi:hypothetical protein